MKVLLGKMGLVMWLLFCIGCHAPKMHVFYSGLDKAQWVELTKKLDREGVTYLPNSHLGGTEYRQPTLVYFPSDLTTEFVEKLTVVVKSLGFERLDVNVFNRHKHFYSKGNLGLYFPIQNKQTAFPNLLYSADCDYADSRLTLLASGRWRAFSRDISPYIEGKWQYHAPYLTLIYAGTHGEFQQVYEAQQHQVITLQGPKKATTYQVLGHNSYPLALFNCNLQIIFAE